MFRYFNIFNMFLVSIFYIFSSIIFHFIFRRGYIMIRKSYKAPAWCSGRITKGERTSASKFTESICRIYLPLTIVQTYATSKLIRSTNFPRASVFRIPVKKVRSPRFAFNRKQFFPFFFLSYQFCFDHCRSTFHENHRKKDVSTSIYLSTTLQIAFDPPSFKLLCVIVYCIFVRVTFAIKTKFPRLSKY